MRGRQLEGTTVLIVEPELEAALDLQDLLVDAGALVFTAYRVERAEELLHLPRVTCVLMRRSVFDANSKLKSLLSQRQIPGIVYSGSSTAKAIVGELKMRVDASQQCVRHEHPERLRAKPRTSHF